MTYVARAMRISAFHVTASNTHFFRRYNGNSILWRDGDVMRLRTVLALDGPAKLLQAGCQWLLG